jgi:hypothetical protein
MKTDYLFVPGYDVDRGHLVYTLGRIFLFRFKISDARSEISGTRYQIPDTFLIGSWIEYLLNYMFDKIIVKFIDIVRD